MIGRDRSAWAAWLRRFRPLGLGLLVLWLTSLVALLAQRPPAAHPSNAALEEFSAERAMSVLRRILSPELPHPVGSVEARAVRTRLEGELRRLSLEPRVLSGMSCGRFGICAEVQNVVAELPGRRLGNGVALAAHYDSVPASTGAADDGAGVAALLEVARALSSSQPLDHPVWFLFTDGEEMGLLGAEHLVRHADFWQRIDWIINLEARGVSGPSLLFETSVPSGTVVRSFARSLTRPVTSSIFSAAYRQLPNDTDFTVFARSGKGGVNFAFIEGAQHYHTPSDNIEQLSLRSLQHHGEQALSLARNLGGLSLRASDSNSIFFDILGRWVVHFSVSTGRTWVILSSLLGLALLVWSVHQRRVNAHALFSSSLAWIGGVALLLVWGLLLDAALRTRPVLDQPWPATAPFVLLAAYLGALGALLGVASLGGDALESRSVHMASLVCWLVLAGLLALRLPEALFIALVPAATLILSAAVTLAAEPRVLWQTAGLAAAVPAILVWAPIAKLTHDALGVSAPAVTTVVAGGVLLPLLPTFAALSRSTQRQAALAAVALGAVSALLGASLPSHSRSHPARINLAHHQDLDSGQARFLTDALRLPDAQALSLPFQHVVGDPYPWFLGASARFQAQAPPRASAAPRLSVLSSSTHPDASRTLELLLLPADSSALALTLSLPSARLSRISVEGQPGMPARQASLAHLTLASPRASGTRLQLVLAGAEPVSAQLIEHIRGLPASGGPLARARDRIATTLQMGDLSIVSRNTTF